MVGRDLSVLIPDDHRDEQFEVLERIRRGEPAFHYEAPRVRKDGVRIEDAVSVSPIRDETGTIIGFYRDTDSALVLLDTGDRLRVSLHDLDLP